MMATGLCMLFTCFNTFTSCWPAELRSLEKFKLCIMFHICTPGQRLCEAALKMLKCRFRKVKKNLADACLLLVRWSQLSILNGRSPCLMMRNKSDQLLPAKTLLIAVNSSKFLFQFYLSVIWRNAKLSEITWIRNNYHLCRASLHRSHLF